MPDPLHQLIIDFLKSEKISVAFLGHVDSGKSTAIGRMFHDLHLWPAEDFESTRRAATEMGKSSFRFAWLCDTFRDERERGTTIHGSHRFLVIDGRELTLLDLPGPRSRA